MLSFCAVVLRRESVVGLMAVALVLGERLNAGARALAYVIVSARGLKQPNRAATASVIALAVRRPQIFATEVE